MKRLARSHHIVGRYATIAVVVLGFVIILRRVAVLVAFVKRLTALSDQRGRRGRR